MTYNNRKRLRKAKAEAHEANENREAANFFRSLVETFASRMDRGSEPGTIAEEALRQLYDALYSRALPHETVFRISWVAFVADETEPHKCKDPLCAYGLGWKGITYIPAEQHIQSIIGSALKQAFIKLGRPLPTESTPAKMGMYL